MKLHGELTAALAEYLGQKYADKKLVVFHDHGNQVERGKIVSWYGSPRMPERSTELSQLDIAVFDQVTARALVLIEVEETNDRPKTLLGDAFGTLLGTQISYKGRRIKVGPWTALIMMVQGSEDHNGRNSFLVEQIELSKRNLNTGNSLIGKVIIENFSDEEDLRRKTGALIDQAVLNKSVSALYRVLQRTDTGVEVIAEVRDGDITGRQAEYVREELEYWGYPAVPLDEAMNRFRFANGTFIGYERIPPLDEK